MDRRGFLGLALAAPIAVKAATLLPPAANAAPPPALVPTHGVAGQVAFAGEITQETYTYHFLESDAPWVAEKYSRSYAIRACGPEGRIVKVWRNGKEVEIDGKVLSIRNGTLYAQDADVTDTQGAIPHYVFGLVRAV